MDENVANFQEERVKRLDTLELIADGVELANKLGEQGYLEYDDSEKASHTFSELINRTDDPKERVVLAATIRIIKACTRPNIKLQS